MKQLLLLIMLTIPSSLSCAAPAKSPKEQLIKLVHRFRQDRENKIPVIFNLERPVKESLIELNRAVNKINLRIDSLLLDTYELQRLIKLVPQYDSSSLMVEIKDTQKECAERPIKAFFSADDLEACDNLTWEEDTALMQVLLNEMRLSQEGV